MPRAPRAIAESGFYHVILRGNGKQIIFEDDPDAALFSIFLQRGLPTPEFAFWRGVSWRITSILCWRIPRRR